MKKNIATPKKSIFSILILLIVMLFTTKSNAQDHTLKTNLANLFLSGGSIHYEHVLNEKTSAQAGVFLSSLTIGDTKFSGFGFIPQYRFYPGSRNQIPHGFFVAPLLGYQTFSLEAAVSEEQAKASYSLIGAGVDIGSQWLVSRAFLIELSLGVSFNSTNLSIDTNHSSESFDIDNFGGTTPRLGISFGYAF
ncbi:MAG: DUF3575 domain-containing protein [Balneolales bacterium]